MTRTGNHKELDVFSSDHDARIGRSVFSNPWKGPQRYTGVVLGEGAILMNVDMALALTGSWDRHRFPRFGDASR